MIKQELLQKIQNKQAVVGIIGLGYVGLPLMIRYAEEGFPVLGFDVDSKKVENILEKKSYINHITQQSMQALPNNAATLDFKQISDVDVIIICVPTPLSEHMEPDLSHVTRSMDSITPYLKKGQMISLESTTYPGTTDEKIVPPVQASGFQVGVDFFVVYSPEREDPNNKKYNTRTIPKVCGGVTEACLEVGKYFMNKELIKWFVSALQKLQK